jgi:hypothetical protein
VSVRFGETLTEWLAEEKEEEAVTKATFEPEPDQSDSPKAETLPPLHLLAVQGTTDGLETDFFEGPCMWEVDEENSSEGAPSGTGLLNDVEAQGEGCDSSSSTSGSDLEVMVVAIKPQRGGRGRRRQRK